MLMRKTETPVEMAERLLPVIDSIFCGSLSGEKAGMVIREGESVLRKLNQADHGLLIESLRVSIELAKKEVDYEV